MNYPSSNPLEELKNLFTRNKVFSGLILANTGIWLLVKAVQVVFFLFNRPGREAADNWILNFLALPASLPGFLSEPWTLFTYMFLHIGFFHILFNLLWLYWFGKIFLEFLSSRKLLLTYILGGISGGICYMLAFNLFPVFRDLLPVSRALGASASVMAVVTAISFYVPNYSIQLLFIGRVRIIYLVIVLFIFDFFAIPSCNSGGHIAHIGGALFGFLYAVLLLKGKLNFRFGGFSVPDAFKKFFSSGKTGRSSTPYSGRPKSDEDYNAEKAADQRRTDEILEKISRGGYDSLTREEKDFLFRSSNRNR